MKTRTFTLIFLLLTALAPSAQVMAGDIIPGLRLSWPIHNDPSNIRGKQLRLTQPYAEFNAVPQIPNKYHTGIDIAADRGTPVFAATTGVISKIQGNDTTCSTGTGCEDHTMGNTIIIKHVVGSNIVYTQYSHMNSIPAFWLKVCGPVDKGRKFRRTCIDGVRVDESTQIGTVGGSGAGSSTKWPIHLHFEVKDNNFIGDSTTQDDGNPSTGGVNWGYTPSTKLPGAAGYHDPIVSLHPTSDLSASLDIVLNESADIVLGPGGLNAAGSMSGLYADGGSYGRITSGGPGAQYKVSRYAPATTANYPATSKIPCKRGWYEVLASFADAGQQAGAKANSGWICADKATPVSPPRSPSIAVTPGSGLQGFRFSYSGNNFTASRGYSFNIVYPAGISHPAGASGFNGRTGDIGQFGGKFAFLEKGTYSAVGVDNTTGSFSNTATWKVTEPTSSFVLTTPASNITSDSATLKGRVNPRGSAGEVLFFYTTRSDFVGLTETPHQAVAANSVTQSFSQPVSGLGSGTWYFRMDFINSSNGNYTQGLILDFTIP